MNDEKPKPLLDKIVGFTNSNPVLADDLVVGHAEWTVSHARWINTRIPGRNRKEKRAWLAQQRRKKNG